MKTPYESEFANRVSQLLQQNGIEYQSNPILGGFRPDFVAKPPDGRFIVMVKENLLCNCRETEKKAYATYAAYKTALMEQQLKRWITTTQLQGWPERGFRISRSWLERAKEGEITEADRKRAVWLAWALLNLFHEDVCQHRDHSESCVVKSARDALKPFT